MSWMSRDLVAGLLEPLERCLDAALTELGLELAAAELESPGEPGASQAQADRSRAEPGAAQAQVDGSRAEPAAQQLRGEPLSPELGVARASASSAAVVAKQTGVDSHEATSSRSREPARAAARPVTRLRFGGRRAASSPAAPRAPEPSRPGDPARLEHGRPSSPARAHEPQVAEGVGHAGESVDPLVARASPPPRLLVRRRVSSRESTARVGASTRDVQGQALAAGPEVEARADPTMTRLAPRMQPRPTLVVTSHGDTEPRARPQPGRLRVTASEAGTGTPQHGSDTSEHDPPEPLSMSAPAIASPPTPHRTDTDERGDAAAAGPSALELERTLVAVLSAAARRHGIEV